MPEILSTKVIVLIVLNLCLGGLFIFVVTRPRVEAELPDHHVVVYIGWPTSSWLDRLAIGLMFLNLERLPRLFPEFGFIIRYTTKVPLAEEEAPPQKSAAGKPHTEPEG